MFAIVVFNIVKRYLNHLKFRCMCVTVQIYACCSACYVVSNERDESKPTN